MSSSVPKDIAKAAAEQMLATIYSKRAQYRVQQVTNGHENDDQTGINGQTYAEQYAELDAAETRLRNSVEFGDLLPKLA